MRSLLLILLIPISMLAFEPYPVTPYPVVGYRETPFFDDFQKVDRMLLSWYPVEPTTVGTKSDSPWDLFYVAINAVPAQSTAKMPVIAISHGYTGNPISSPG